MILEKYKKQLDENAKIIKQVDNQKLPNLYWFLHTQKGKRLDRLICLIDVLRQLDEKKYRLLQRPNMWGGYCSVRYLAEKGKEIAKDHLVWHSFVIQALALGLIYRHLPTIEEEQAYKEYKQHKAKSNGFIDESTTENERATSLLGVPLYTLERLMLADKQALKLRYSRVSTYRISKEAVIQIWGQKIANTIYQDQRVEALESKKIAWGIVVTARELIKEKGYASKIELLNDTALYLWRTQGISRNWRYETEKYYQKLGRAKLEENGIKYHPPSKQEMDEYDLKDRRWIYTL